MVWDCYACQAADHKAIIQRIDIKGCLIKYYRAFYRELVDTVLDRVSDMRERTNLKNAKI